MQQISIGSNWFVTKNEIFLGTSLKFNFEIDYTQFFFTSLSNQESRQIDRHASWKFDLEIWKVTKLYELKPFDYPKDNVTNCYVVIYLWQMR